MPVSMLCDLKGIKKWIPIYYKGEKAGDILIHAKYIPPSITESLRLDDAKKLSAVSGTKQIPTGQIPLTPQNMIQRHQIRLLLLSIYHKCK
ncbi:hypothetical protein FGO68_gene708 [Halteria grandinella]|uniref:Uncharacterized protein n=1 Tax=Halteria grandinella TaxID=5974 RepID=A0A8J8NZ30_HALGN|nr:hypothetical protein FGO68_gene708 [Halteria grandinella]